MNEESLSSNLSGETVDNRKQWRSVLYKLSASGFSYPGTETVKNLKDGKFLSGMLKVSHIFNLGLEDTIIEVRQTIQDLSTESLTERIESEYVRLFVADTGGARVKPFGSFYLDGEVMGESVKKVTSLYGESGMVKTESYQGQPDHIGVELEFLFKLTQASFEDRYDLHAKFYDELLGPWLEEFTNEVTKATKQNFYPLMANWVYKGLEADRELVEELRNLESAGSDK
jgi:TorA maturation chaperone TorD